MKLHEFTSYEEYLNTQFATFAQKAGSCWLSPSEKPVLRRIVQDYQDEDIPFGICHGVRTGSELVAFQGMTANVVGTDVGTSLHTLEGVHVIVHDFQKPIPGYEGLADFVYSNSLDHASDPKRALQVWTEQLWPGGLLLLHWSPDHNNESPATWADCFDRDWETKSAKPS